MKKSSQETVLFNNDHKTNKKIKIEKNKTTNVNILLNRVRLDKKKKIKKKIFFLSLLVLSISSFIVFIII